MCSNVVLVHSPGHFYRTAGVELSKDVCCDLCVLCSHAVLAHLPGHFFNRTAGIGLTKDVWCAWGCCVVVVCSWTNQYQQSCYTTVLAIEQTHNYNTALA